MNRWLQFVFLLVSALPFPCAPEPKLVLTASPPQSVVRVSSYRDADGNMIQYRHDENGNLTNLIY